MTEECETAEPARRGLHWLLAVPLSLWCLLWLVSNGYNYVHLTWHLVRTLKWMSFLLLLSPCFWIWVGVFSSSVWAPLNFWLLPWGRYDRELSRTKIFLLVLFVPFVLGLALQYIGPYFYPIGSNTESGGVFIRFIPILGGRGYSVDGHEVTW